MPTKTIEWKWEEAFDKFGFDDGDGPNFTDAVAGVLNDLGFECECRVWGVHNYLIIDVTRNGTSIRPDHVEPGYADPRTWLPPDVVARLDGAF